MSWLRYVYIAEIYLILPRPAGAYGAAGLTSYKDLWQTRTAKIHWDVNATSAHMQEESGCTSQEVQQATFTRNVSLVLLVSKAILGW